MAEKKSKKLTFPVSDTFPGPGTYEGTVIETEERSTIPAVETKETIEHFGHGTAKDVPSISLTPERYNQ